MRKADPYSRLVDDLADRELFCPRSACPSHSEASSRRDGFGPPDARLWCCSGRGAELTLLTGTVLENSKKTLATWLGFICLTLFAVSLDACDEMRRICRRPTREWHRRLFAVIDGYQDRIALRGRVWSTRCASTTPGSRRATDGRASGVSYGRRPASRSGSTPGEGRWPWSAGTAHPPPSG